MYDIEPYIFSSAVKIFWETRKNQSKEQATRGVSDQGARSSVTGGKQMYGFCQKISELLTNVGVKQSNILFSRNLELPGFYRPTKEWDIVVVSDGVLIAAIELKSQVGPSFGNNFNNRTEEAIGSAVDIWTAYREGAFQNSPTPWIGYLFLLEDCAKSRTGGIRVREPNFKVFSEFQNAPYSRRYELLCRKLVLERQYSAACFIMADRQKESLKNNYIEPAKDLSVSTFISQLLRHVAR